MKRSFVFLSALFIAGLISPPYCQPGAWVNRVPYPVCPWEWRLMVIPGHLALWFLPAITAWLYGHRDARTIRTLNLCVVGVPWLASYAIEVLGNRFAPGELTALSLDPNSAPALTLSVTLLVTVGALLLGLAVGGWLCLFFWSRRRLAPIHYMHYDSGREEHEQ